MNPLYLETPLFESQALSRVSGHPIWLNLEAVQPPGSFKIRGIGHACQEYARRGARRFILSTGGNAGVAVAYAGRKLGVSVVVTEPACGASFAAIYDGAPEIAACESALVIICGGAGVSVEQLQRWSNELS